MRIKFLLMMFIYLKSHQCLIMPISTNARKIKNKQIIL